MKKREPITPTTDLSKLNKPKINLFGYIKKIEKLLIVIVALSPLVIAINSKNLYVDLNDLLYKPRKDVIIRLQNAGINSNQVNKLLLNFKNLDKNDQKTVILVLGNGISNRDLKNLTFYCNLLDDDMKRINKYLNSGQIKEASSLLISIKGQLEGLRTKYKIETREAEAEVLEFRKACNPTK